LLVLVMLSAAEDNGWESPLFSGARGKPRGPAPDAETVSLASGKSRARGSRARRKARTARGPGASDRPGALGRGDLRSRERFGSVRLCRLLLSWVVGAVHGAAPSCRTGAGD
jgi:hypothetical protein